MVDRKDGFVIILLIIVIAIVTFAGFSTRNDWMPALIDKDELRRKF